LFTAIWVLARAGRQWREDSEGALEVTAPGAKEELLRITCGGEQICRDLAGIQDQVQEKHAADSAFDFLFKWPSVDEVRKDYVARKQKEIEGLLHALDRNAPKLRTLRLKENYSDFALKRIHNGEVRTRFVESEIGALRMEIESARDGDHGPAQVYRKRLQMERLRAEREDLLVNKEGLEQSLREDNKTGPWGCQMELVWKERIRAAKMSIERCEAHVQKIQAFRDKLVRFLSRKPTQESMDKLMQDLFDLSKARKMRGEHWEEWREKTKAKTEAFRDELVQELRDGLTQEAVRKLKQEMKLFLESDVIWVP